MKFFLQILFSVFPCILCFGITEHTDMATDANGNGWLALQKQNASGSVIEVVYSPSSAMLNTPCLSTPIVLSDPNFYSEKPRLSVNSLGDIAVIWVSYDPTLQRRCMYGSVMQNGTSWTTPVKLSQNDENITGDPEITLSSNGNIIVVWDSLLDTGSLAINVINGYVFNGWSSVQRVIP